MTPPTCSTTVQVLMCTHTLLSSAPSLNESWGRCLRMAVACLHPTNCVCQLNCFDSACPLMSKGLLSFVFFLQCHASGMPACPYTHAPPRCPDGECSWSDSQAMDCEASTHQTSQEECTAKKLNYSLSDSREQTWCASLWSGWYTHSQWYDGSQQFLHCTTQPPAGPPFRYLHSIHTGHELV